MKAITNATNAIRNTKHSQYLTHGSDTYDKKGLNKARRQLDAALIQESLQEDKHDAQAPTSTHFRLVIETQVYENYGYRWKPKGGNEYHVQIGNANAVLALGSKGLEDLVNKHRSKIERKGDEDALHSSDEYIINWAIYGDQEPTPEEQDDFMDDGRYSEMLARWKHRRETGWQS